MPAQATIGFGFTSYWLKKWHENFAPIIEWGNAKPKQFANYFRHSIENRSIPTIQSTNCSWIGCQYSISMCGFSIACSQCLYSPSTCTQYPRCTVPMQTSRILPWCLTLKMSVTWASLSGCMSITNSSQKFGASVWCAVFVLRLLSFLPENVTSSLTKGSTWDKYYGDCK